MSDFTLRSLRGGLNNSDPKIGIPDDQCTTAVNVEFFRSMLGERRRGTDAIDLPASITAHDRVTFVHRHTPDNDLTAAELWVLGVTGTASATLARKTTAWADITVGDTPTLTGFSQYEWQAVSFNGKIIIAYDSGVDRLHCVDAGSTTMRRLGLAEPDAPTAADSGSGSFATTRYYRVRYTVQSAGVTLRRSEPSESVAITPSGSGSGVTVTKPDSISESETHWELEASLDDANFYVIATTVVGTTTVTDTQDAALGYAEEFDLSEDVGDYTLIPSGKFLVVDEDRLLIGGSNEVAADASKVRWTPVREAEGNGNDERLEADTDPEATLDGREGGGLTGMARASLGTIWCFKTKGVYKLVRSGIRTRAYDVVCITKEMGAIAGSVVAGIDERGRGCVYFFDPDMGFCRAGVGGIFKCGEDIRTSWESINLAAAKVVCSSVFFPAARQVQWCIATDSSDTPTLGLTLQTNETRLTDDGVRRGWTTFNGNRAKALAQCLFSTNIDDGVARNQVLRPFIGLEGLGLVHRCDTGNDDNGTAYAARIVTKPYSMKSLLQKFGIKSAALLGKAVTGAVVTVKLIRDFGLETVKTVASVTFDASVAGETDVIKVLDNYSGSELRVAEFEFVDPATAGTRFELNQLCLVDSAQQKN